MGTPSMQPNLTGRAPTPPAAGKGGLPEGLKTLLIVLALIGVLYLWYDGYQYRQSNQADIAKLNSQVQALENKNKAGEAKLSTLKGEIDQTQQAVGSTKKDLRDTAQRIQTEGQKTKTELSQQLATKADASLVHEQVQAAKTEAETKIGQVSTEVGGVKTEVGNVKSDLASTKRDLEGTQRQLIDVRETLTAAVAKNASELDVLRRKGERDYTEFEIPRKNQLTKVEDIRVLLNKTDPKKGKYSLTILVDDNKLEKKDRVINEPLQFLVGRNRLRYELVINWVQKDKVGGYLSIPKDKSLAAERPAKE